MITKGQIQRIHGLLSKLPLINKAELVPQYSAGGETSTTKLSYGEAERLIGDLEKMVPDAVAVKPGDKQRKLIIHLARQMGWEKEGKADMQHIEDWCKSYGMFHKGLNEHDLVELPQLVTQFQRVYKSYLKAVNK